MCWSFRKRWKNFGKHRLLSQSCRRRTRKDQKVRETWYKRCCSYSETHSSLTRTTNSIFPNTYDNILNIGSCGMLVRIGWMVLCCQVLDWTPNWSNFNIYQFILSIWKFWAYDQQGNRVKVEIFYSKTDSSACFSDSLIINHWSEVDCYLESWEQSGVDWKWRSLLTLIWPPVERIHKGHSPLSPLLTTIWHNTVHQCTVWH